MITYTGTEQLINELGIKCYNENKPLNWDESYSSTAYFAAIPFYLEDGITVDYYYFECPTKYQTWLEAQSEFVDLIDITNELIIE